MLRRCGHMPLALCMMLVVAACSSRTSTTTTAETVALETTTTTLVDVADVTGHLVEIRAEGLFAPAGQFETGTGTGVIVSSDGLILTVATAVVGADRVNVFVPGEQFPLEATIQAVGQCANLALLKVDGSYKPPELGEAGTPAAILSVIDREPHLDAETRELDASGAPVGDWSAGGVAIDSSGRIAGMVVGQSGTQPALMPIDDLVSWLNRMRLREVVDQLGFAALDGDDGVIVTGVDAGSDAATAGLQAGDVITRVVGGSANVPALCQAFAAGGPIGIELIRDGRRHLGEIRGTSIRVASARTQQQLREAVVRVDAFVPGFEAPGTGTGFFISDDGLAVTNYHVVAGADRVELVFDGGERRVDAAIVGRSMCHDLAVIRAEGVGYTFLEWAPDPPVLEEPVRVIGFPLSTDNLTIQTGAVAKERGDEVSFAPLLPLFEHSAEVNRGNSGGPVVNELGEVLGVTNAINVTGPSVQELAIVGLQAASVVEELRSGDLIHPGFWSFIDVNTSERFLGRTNLTVDRVDPGGLADRAGVVARDDVVDIGAARDLTEGLDISGTCAVMSSAETAELPVIVHRWLTGDHYRGRLGQALNLIPLPFVGFDPTFSITASIPGDWADLQPIVPAEDNDWKGFRAGVSVEEFLDDFGRSPGTRVLLSQQLFHQETTEAYLQETIYGQCVPSPIDAARVDDLVGHRRVWSNCYGRGFEIRSYAFDTPEGLRILVLTAADSVEIDWVTDLVLGSLSYEAALLEE